jgi:hypothetical protein
MAPRLVPWHLSKMSLTLWESSSRGPCELEPLWPERHGDFALWNLMLGRYGTWTLLDWEDGRPDAPPFLDIFHFLAQSNQELPFPRGSAIVNGIVGRGWIGRSSALKQRALGFP